MLPLINGLGAGDRVMELGHGMGRALFDLASVVRKMRGVEPDLHGYAGCERTHKSAFAGAGMSITSHVGDFWSLKKYGREHGLIDSFKLVYSAVALAYNKRPVFHALGDYHDLLQVGGSFIADCASGVGGLMPPGDLHRLREIVEKEGVEVKITPGTDYRKFPDVDLEPFNIGQYTKTRPELDLPVGLRFTECGAAYYVCTC